jgi:hypothetical protein
MDTINSECYVSHGQPITINTAASVQPVIPALSNRQNASWQIRYIPIPAESRTGRPEFVDYSALVYLQQVTRRDGP